jgi:hypothetical protein
MGVDTVVEKFIIEQAKKRAGLNALDIPSVNNEQSSCAPNINLNQQEYLQKEGAKSLLMLHEYLKPVPVVGWALMAGEYGLKAWAGKSAVPSASDGFNLAMSAFGVPGAGGVFSRGPLMAFISHARENFVKSDFIQHVAICLSKETQGISTAAIANLRKLANQVIKNPEILENLEVLDTLKGSLKGINGIFDYVLSQRKLKNLGFETDHVGDLNGLLTLKVSNEYNFFKSKIKDMLHGPINAAQDLSLEFYKILNSGLPKDQMVESLKKSMSNFHQFRNELARGFTREGIKKSWESYPK